MTLQTKRQKYIIQILQKNSEALSITEIDNLVFDENHFKCNRRTIARDLEMMEAAGIILKQRELNKSVYRINPSRKITIELTPEDLQEIHRVLNKESTDEWLKEKIKKMIGE